jgi:hypothetical protein
MSRIPALQVGAVLCRTYPASGGNSNAKGDIRQHAPRNICWTTARSFQRPWSPSARVRNAGGDRLANPSAGCRRSQCHAGG